MEPGGSSRASETRSPFPRPPWRVAPGPSGRTHEWYRWTGVTGMLYASKVFGLSRVTLRNRDQEKLERRMRHLDRLASEMGRYAA